MAANKHRGEVPIKLGGVDYVLRPTFSALSQIETDLNIRLLPLLTRYSSSDIGIWDAATIIYHGLKASGASLSLDKVGELLLTDGLTEHMEEVILFLTNGLSGAREGNGEGAAESS